MSDKKEFLEKLRAALATQATTVEQLDMIKKISDDDLLAAIGTMTPLMFGKNKYGVIEVLEEDLIYLEMCLKNVSTPMVKKQIQNTISSVKTFITTLRNTNFNKRPC